MNRSTCLQPPIPTPQTAQQPLTMPTLSTNYLLPAILLNPAFILHLFNTFVSHLIPPPPTISHSPHPFMESLGPLPGAKSCFDVHADDNLCWRYTMVMVCLQVLAFGRVSDNRMRRKRAKAERLERERIAGEKTSTIGKTWAGPQVSSESASNHEFVNENGFLNAELKAEVEHREDIKDNGVESEESLTETSEEEMII
ncbi:hypothetical protein B7494_g7377 [Chlorociboria aeruginascens]|nr:hypothetical protein B7494_g7377 [Chlorociboria aeruginascens]